MTYTAEDINGSILVSVSSSFFDTIDASPQSSALDAIEHGGAIDDRKMLVSSLTTGRTSF